MKDLDKHINEGERPSRLDLGRLWTGELDGAEAARVRDQAEAQEPSRAWLASLDHARDDLPPFDAEILRKRAFRIQEDDARDAARQVREAARPRAAWWQRWLPVGAVLAAAALAIVAVLPEPTTRSQHVTPYELRDVKGFGDLEFLLLRDGEVHVGSPDETHWAGDRIQFRYRTVGQSTLVLLSVDGRGRLNLYYPASGDEPVPVVPGEAHMLEGSIVLDDAPEFELVLAFFGHDSVAAVVDEVEAIWEEEGREGLLLLAEEYADVDAILLRKGETRPDAER